MTARASAGLRRSRPVRGRPVRGRPNVAAGLLTLVWLVIVGVPLYAIVSDSLQPSDQYTAAGPLSPPHHLTFANFGTALANGFGRYILNTAIVTAVSVVLTLALAVPVAYAIVRSRNRLVAWTFRMFLMGLAIPAQATIIPVYLIITRLHLYDSLTAIILPTVAFALPLSILVLCSSLRDVPRELYEAMTLEGAGSVRLLCSLVLPLSRAGIATVSIFTALSAWNGFLFPLILTQSVSSRVYTLGLWQYQSQFGAINVPGLMAAVLLCALPVLVLYLLARRWLIAGLAGIGGR